VCACPGNEKFSKNDFHTRATGQANFSPNLGDPTLVSSSSRAGDIATDFRAEAVCPACGQAPGDAPIEVFHASKLFACTACDLHFWHPVAMPDAGWHESAYQGRDHTAMPLEPGHRFFLSDPKAPRSGRLLDIGCGVGNFLAAARDAGFEVTGVELNQNAVRFAREHYGLPRVVAMRPKEFLGAHPGERFDVVTFFEVLEHQDDPAGFFDLAAAALAQEGYIALSVPNRNRWQKAADTLDYPPNHLTRWSQRALGNFCEMHGFEVLSMREEPLGVRRAAQVMSSGLRTRLVARVAGETPPTLADLAEMAPGHMESTMARLALNRRHRLASFLVQCKNLGLMPLAGILLPYLRLRGRTGLYLYCLARRRRKASSGGSAGRVRV
jgi:SAM-dependent methyltransferase